MAIINLVQTRDYRRDIDGLRAIAVLAVIIFHFGYLPNGFLGVDIFFVISGYLITGIIYNEISEARFSIVNFYLRRTRRIIPLTLFISIVALAIGTVTMLPNDLKSLAQSVVATNFFSNNILQVLTTKNYWDVINEYKPLMHTWSLGIEEQYYLLYPLLFLIIGKKKSTWLLPLLSFLTIASIVAFFLPYDDYQKFYLIPFRFFELSIGGIAAILLRNRLLDHKFSPYFLVALIFILCSHLHSAPPSFMLITITLLTLGIISSSNEKSKITAFVLENKLVVAIGTISFSLYMWHQVLLSYVRYFIYQELHATHLIVILISTFSLSIFSYYLIEQPFRNKSKVNTLNLLSALGLTFLLLNMAAFYIYLKGGVLKDVPELDITKSQGSKKMHSAYNERIHNYDRNFRSKKRVKVLVIGNSFARDWANVLLESKYKNNLEISYILDPYNHSELKDRMKQSDIVFYSTPSQQDIKRLNIDSNKLWVVGTKNFGTSNGIFYNYIGNDYCNQRTPMESGYLERNKLAQQEWGEKYIDIIGTSINSEQTLPVFTPQCKFISQDNRHFTKAGAVYFAHLFEKRLQLMIGSNIGYFPADPVISKI